jgi:molecular chaperone GrpE
MSDEEKQLDNTAQQTDESGAVSQENRSEAFAAPEVDLSVESDLESQPKSDEQMAEASGETWEAVAAESATEVSSTDGELTALENLKRENEALKSQLEDLNQQCDSFKTQSVRIAADFDNFRKRTAKEKEDLEQQVKRVTISELLPVVDNFERARSQIKPQNDGEMTIHKSYQGVYKQLVDCLKRLGVSPMRPEGQEFDPNLHEAVMREPTDQHPEGTVIEQLMRGYMLNDRVLRHAMVKVASAPEYTSEESGENSDQTSG